MDRRQDDGEAGGGRPEGAESGQSTVEYALVLLAFLATIVGMGAIWHASRDGRLADLARAAASHAMASGLDVKVLQDVTAF